MVDNTAQLESTAPELLPLWLKHGHQVPEELALDLNFGGVRHCRPTLQSGSAAATSENALITGRPSDAPHVKSHDK